MNEQELIARVIAGDADAERELFDTHVDRVFRLAVRMCGDPGRAQEFAQDVFVKAFAKLDGFRGDAALSTWLHRITVTVVLDGIRKEKRRRKREVGVEDLTTVDRGREAGDPGLKVRLLRAIDGLSEILRAVFVMHDIEGFKHHEIAAILEVPEGTSKARLFRARQQLRETLGSFQGAEEPT